VPTVTRAKGPSSLFSFKIEWREQDCDTLRECLDIYQHTEPERAQRAIEAIEHDLNACLNWMQRGADAPLPAHIVAALKPIAAQAEQLASLIDPARLPVAFAVRCVSSPTNSIWMTSRLPNWRESWTN